MTGTTSPPDKIDRIIEQWQQERPDLELASMATIGRLKLCTELIRRRLDACFAEFDLSGWEFDVLATLRRSGAPYSMTPTDLFSALMITSGTMTHRLHRLESRGLVIRVPHAGDARSMLVQLTSTGLELIDRAGEAHVANEREILSALTARERSALDVSLKRLLAILEGPT